MSSAAEEGAVRSRPRLVASMTWMFPGKGAAEGYAGAAALGFDAIEHSFPYDLDAESTAQLLAEHGLEMASMYAPCRFREGEKGYACVPGREVEFEQGVAIALDYARAVGCRLLGVLAGEIPAGAPKEPYLDVLVKNLQRAADAAASNGVAVMLEPICSRRIPNFALHTLAQGAAVLERVARANVSLCFDTFHVAMEAGSVIESFDRYRAQIGYFQIANTPGRNGAGEGELDLPLIVDHVLRAGWDRWISCEYTPAGAESAAMQWATPFIERGRIAELRR